MHTQTQYPELLLALDLVGVFAFALSGALVGVRKGLDLFGVLVLAAVTALGGGIVRDMILQVRPANLTDWRLLVDALAAGLLAFGYARTVQRLSRIVLVLDALGLATFMMTGTVKALGLDAPAIEAVAVGLITAVGGGMMRDVLAGVVPAVLRTELYALPALAGGAAYVLARHLGVTGPMVVTVCAAAIFLVRIASLRWRWSAPRPRQELS